MKRYFLKRIDMSQWLFDLVFWGMYFLGIAIGILLTTHFSNLLS